MVLQICIPKFYRNDFKHDLYIYSNDFIFFNYRYNFFCDTCGKQFCRPFELRRHMAVKHGEGEMPYPCDQCEKKFFEPKELRSHIAITHQGELIRNIKWSNKAFF